MDDKRNVRKLIGVVTISIKDILSDSNTEAASKLVDKDLEIAGLSHDLDEALSLLKESLEMINAPRQIEVTDNHISRVTKFLESTQLTENQSKIVSWAKMEIQSLMKG